MLMKFLSFDEGKSFHEEKIGNKKKSSAIDGRQAGRQRAKWQQEEECI